MISFFGLAYAITWLFSVIATPGLLRIDLPPIVRAAGAILCHWGPALAAVIVTAATGGRAAVGRLLRGLTVRRVGTDWYLIVLLYPFAARLMATGLDVLLGGTAPTPFSSRGAPSGNPLVLAVPIFIGILVQAGLAEEIGWRGFALPHLQKRYSALVSSLILGVLWAGWHFHPLNWQVMRPVALWYVLSTMPFTILLTWIFNGSGSLLLAALFHTASNFSDWVLPVAPFLSGTGEMRPYLLLILVNTVTAAVIVAATGVRAWVRPPQEGALP